MNKRWLILAYGILFGLLLSRSGFTDYDFLQRMFLLQEFHLYGVFGTAVALNMAGLWLLRRRGTTITGEALQLPADKPVDRGHLLGGMLFGMGWALTGMCPGPILVNIGEGKVYALAALAGAVAGAWIVGGFNRQIASHLGMPEA